MWSTIGPKGLGMAAIIILAFVNSVRGTFAYHKVINSTNIPKDTLGVKYWIVSIAILVIVLFAGISLMKQSDKLPDSGITSNDSDINEMDIYSAATFGNVDEIESILAEKPELVNAKDEKGTTPLHLAVSVFGNKEAVELLITKGANVNTKEDSFGATPLHMAIFWGNMDIVKLLVANGADVNAKRDDIGATPLHMAADKGLKDIVEFLMSKGADINGRDAIGGTALHHLVQTGQKDNTDMIEFLLSKGADINAKDNAVDGTPLHYASMNGYINIVRFLIDKGADVTCQGKDGVTALSLAEHEGHKDIADLLRKHMKEIRDLLSSIGETGYNDKRVIVLTERLKKNAPEINKQLGAALKQEYTFVGTKII
jgi:ankyrin repeat protein